MSYRIPVWSDPSLTFTYAPPSAPNRIWENEPKRFIIICMRWWVWDIRYWRWERRSVMRWVDKGGRGEEKGGGVSPFVFFSISFYVIWWRLPREQLSMYNHLWTKTIQGYIIKSRAGDHVWSRYVASLLCLVDWSNRVNMSLSGRVEHAVASESKAKSKSS